MEGLMRRSILAMALSCLLIAGPAVEQNDPAIAHMKTPPNRTVVTGRLQKFEPAVDGYGGDLEIEVVSDGFPILRRISLSRRRASSCAPSTPSLANGTSPCL